MKKKTVWIFLFAVFVLLLWRVWRASKLTALPEVDLLSYTWPVNEQLLISDGKYSCLGSGIIFGNSDLNKQEFVLGGGKDRPEGSDFAREVEITVNDGILNMKQSMYTSTRIFLRDNVDWKIESENDDQLLARLSLREEDSLFIEEVGTFLLHKNTGRATISIVGFTSEGEYSIVHYSLMCE